MVSSPDAVQRFLNISPLAQLLFAGEALTALSPEAQRILPNIRVGDQASAIFGDALEDFRRFQGSGSVLFPAELGGLRWDVTVSGWEDASLAIITPAPGDRDSATLLALAERVRQPMASIMAVTPKLLAQVDADPAAGCRAAELNQGLYRLLQITENLETYARSELTLRLEQVDLTVWLQDLVDYLTPLFETAGRKLVLQGLESGCLCSMDSRYMQTALLNLASNALKFSEEGSTVTLTCRTRGKSVWISLRDQGAGIPADQMGTIFRRSEHRGALPDPRWGVGLGLPVTRKILEAHGGRVLVESEEGVGTTVHLTLEARPGQCLLRSQVQVPVERSGIDPVLVLLADALPVSAFDNRGIN